MIQHTLLIQRVQIQSRSRKDILQHIEALRQQFSEHLITVREIQENDRTPLKGGFFTIVEVYEEVADMEGEELDE